MGTSDPFSLWPRTVTGTVYKVTAVPAADAAFGAAVHAAVVAVDADDTNPMPGVAERLRAQYPNAVVVERDAMAGYGLTSVWYAFRDGRGERQGRRRILVVDDDPSLADIMLEVIDRDRFELHFAPDGMSALDAIDGWPPDLILLDLHMGAMSGEEFAARYRELPGAQAPLVVLSSAFDAPDQAARMEARSIVKKPFDHAVLAALLDRYA